MFHTLLLTSLSLSLSAKLFLSTDARAYGGRFLQVHTHTHIHAYAIETLLREKSARPTIGCANYRRSGDATAISFRRSVSARISPPQKKILFRSSRPKKRNAVLSQDGTGRGFPACRTAHGARSPRPLVACPSAGGRFSFRRRQRKRKNAFLSIFTRSSKLR